MPRQHRCVCLRWTLAVAAALVAAFTIALEAASLSPFATPSTHAHAILKSSYWVAAVTWFLAVTALLSPCAFPPSFDPDPPFNTIPPVADTPLAVFHDSGAGVRPWP